MKVQSFLTNKYTKFPGSNYRNKHTIFKSAFSDCTLG